MRDRHGLNLSLKRLAAVLVTALAAMIVSLPAQAGPAPDRYIVVLNDNVSDPGSVGREQARAHGAQIGFVYTHALKGYSATIPAGRVDALRADPRVAYVELDGTASIAAQTLPWGIDKIDADVSSTLAGNGSSAISNVNVYIIDSGVDTAHPDLNVVGHVNFAGGPNKDCNGHGTHVAGTVAAKDDTSYVVGASPGSPITGVKVLGCGGSGAWSGVIKGVDWVTANAKKPAIANMSLGGGASQAVDDAVKNSANSGIFYSVAAGNEGSNACSSSPARAGTHNGVATVAATDTSDKEASFSNYGACVDVWAPGVSVVSTRRGGGTTTMSGTSMASPHVGGGAALYLSNNVGASAATVENALKSTAQTTGNTSKDGRTIVREYVGGF
jgi:aqualysin 1